MASARGADLRPARARLCLAGLGLAALAIRAPLARAQTELGIDVQVASRYQWRGITRSAVAVVQPSVAATSSLGCVGSAAPCLSISAGGWTNWQIARASATELGDLAPGRRGLSEVDLWAEGATRWASLDLAGGFVSYFYLPTDSGALRTSADNTTEIYARLRLPRVPVVKPSLVAWVDVDHVKGAFVEASAIAALHLFPAFMNLDLGLAAGASLGQEGFNSAHRGLTYAEINAGPSVLLGSFRVALDVHVQGSFDDLTRRTERPPGIDQRSVFCWVVLSGGYTWMRER